MKEDLIFHCILELPDAFTTRIHKKQAKPLQKSKKHSCRYKYSSPKNKNTIIPPPPPTQRLEICLIYTGGWVAVCLEHWAESWLVDSGGRLSHDYWWWKEEGAHKTVILLLQYVSKVVHIFLKSFPQTELEYCCPPQKQKHLSSSALPYLTTLSTYHDTFVLDDTNLFDSIRLFH